MQDVSRSAEWELRYAIHRDAFILLILVGAFALRLYVALTTTHIWDEERDWALTAQAISFNPASQHLPIRAFNHGALPAYLIKLGSFVFGENPLGFRIVPILAGIATIWMVALIADEWAGRVAARWAAALMAFNEYHAMTSMLATQLVFAMLFGAVAVYLFLRALKEDDPKWLLAAAVPAAVSILCYEIMYLLLPALAAVVLLMRRKWFAGPHLYLGALLGLAMLLPDLIWNLATTNPTEMSYSGHLQRTGGFGFNRHYLLFFFRDAIAAVYAWLNRPLFDGFSEYMTMNALLGTILFGATLVWTWRLATNAQVRADPVAVVLLSSFWFFFLTFSVLTKGTSTRLDNVGWLWVQFILVPSTILAAVALSRLKGSWRSALAAVYAAAALYGAVHSAWTRFHLPQHSVVVLPLGPPVEGEMLGFRAAFLACPICERPVKRELAEIRYNAPDGGTPVFPPGNVAGAEKDKQDFRFDLRIVGNSRYTVTYRTTDRSGRQDFVQFVVWRRILTHKPPYWANEG